jgi:hypothetical protein
MPHAYLEGNVSSTGIAIVEWSNVRLAVGPCASSPNSGEHLGAPRQVWGGIRFAF